MSGKFKPGHDPRRNPGGRPKEVRVVTEAARKRTVRAIRVLQEIMESGTNEGARVRAAEALLDRGWGKPSQPLEHGGADGSPFGLTVRFVDPDDTE